jgi:hypothetical protein
VEEADHDGFEHSSDLHVEVSVRRELLHPANR